MSGGLQSLIVNMTPLAQSGLRGYMQERANNPPVEETPVNWSLVLGILLIVFVLAIGIGVVYYFYAYKRQSQQSFNNLADDRGLNDEEKELLTKLVALAEIKNPAEIFADDQAFLRGSAAYLENMRRTIVMSDDMQLELVTKLDALADKMGLHKGVSGGGRMLLSTSQIKTGAEIVIVPTDGDGSSHRMVVVRTSAAGMIVEASPPANIESNKLWQGCFYDGGGAWEFETRLVKTAEGLYLMRHSDRPVFVNRRAFPRIPVICPGLIAAMPLEQKTTKPTPPKFVNAKLVEIAGPGLKFEITDNLAQTDKMLVVVQVQPEISLTGVGKVRRIQKAADKTIVVVELFGLDDSEIAALTRETNEAAKRLSDQFNMQEEEKRLKAQAEEEARAKAAAWAAALKAEQEQQQASQQESDSQSA